MSAYKAIIRPVLFRFESEAVHDFILNIAPILPAWPAAHRKSLASTVATIDFPSPIGMAAGFDKNARKFKYFYRHGFGSVEVGTLTPKMQSGNLGPRIFRLTDDEAVINRMGFPNSGLEQAIPRIKKFTSRPGPLGINIGANKDSVDKVKDYVEGYRAIASIANYVTINVSSPNTPGLRALETGSALSELLEALDHEFLKFRTPLFLKVSPDLSENEIEKTCDALLRSAASGVIVGNTTVSRPHLRSRNNVLETGGLSGRPLKYQSCKALDLFYSRLKGELPIISVGGISSAEDAYSRVKRGANLLQLYTSFIYEGPSLVQKMNAELAKMLEADGFKCISEAVGVETKGQMTTPRVSRLQTETAEISKAFA